MSSVYTGMIQYLFARYQHSPNVLSLLELLSTPLQDTRDVLEWLEDQLDLDSAEGVILDAYGELLGVPRPPLQEADILWLCEDSEYGDDPDNHFGLAPDSLDEGGYLTLDNGLLSRRYPGEYVSDEDYRQWIRIKISTFREKATLQTLYAYLQVFGIRVKFEENDPLILDLEFEAYDPVDYYTRDYIINKGFRPAGVQIRIKEQTESDSEV